MDERSDRRFQLLIAALVLATLTLIILALPRLVSDIGGLMRWSLAISILFNGTVMVATAIIIVGHVEFRPVAKTLGFVVLSKVVQTALTAAGFLLTVSGPSLTQHVLDAGLLSWWASVLHAVGTLIIAWLLRDMLLGAPLRMEGFPEGIILPGLAEPAAGTVAGRPELKERLAPQEGAALQEPRAPEEPPVVVPVAVPRAAEPEPLEDEEELDRVVATAAPVTEELEALPDSIEPLGPAAEAYAARTDDVVLTVEETLACFKADDVALSADEVRRSRGGDDAIRVPLDVVVEQIEDGVVLVDPWLILDQLPRSTFTRAPEEIAGQLWRGRLELPLARVVAQVPGDAMRRTYEHEQEAVDEFPEPFEDTLGGRVAARVEPVEIQPIPPRLVRQSAELQEVAEETEAGLELVEESASEALASEALASEAPVGEVPVAKAPVETTPSWAAAASRLAPEFLTISAEYVIAQFPASAMAMPIEDIEAKLEPRGKLQVPADEVLPQLAEGYVAIDVAPLLEQLPPGAIGIGWSDLCDALPNGKVELPLDQLVGQIPSDALSPALAQMLQDAADEIAEPFHERAEAAEAQLETAPEPEPPLPPEPIEEAAEPEPVETAAPETALEIAWTELLPQFPPGAFTIDRDRLNRELAGTSARVDMHIVRPQLGEGRVTVPCGYLLAQFPEEYLELSIEQIADQIPESRFELPLVSVVLQLPEEEFALPDGQDAQPATDELPTIFAEPGAEAAAEPVVEQAAPVPPEEMREAPRHEVTPEDELEAAAEKEVAPAQEPVAEEQAVEQPEEPLPRALEGEGLTEGDIDQLEDLLAEKRREAPSPDDEGEFLDEVFDEGEEAPALGVSVLEPEGPALAETSIGALFDAEAREPEQAETPVATTGPVQATGPAEPKPAEPEVQPEYAVEDTASFIEAEAPPLVEATGVEAAAQETEHLVEGIPPEAAGPVEEAAFEKAEAALDAFAVKVPRSAATPGRVDYTRMAHRIEAFRDLVHEYAKYHIEHGNAYLEAGLPIFSFTPVETSAGELAVELRPRIEALARFAVQLGCGAVEHAVLTADKGAVVCERLADEAGGGLVLIATTDKRAAGLIHIEARRHTELLARLSAELWPDEHGPESWPRGEPAHGCEVAWPNGHPYDAIGGQLAAYNVKAIALLRFASGARWMLASSVPLEEAALVGGACYNPSELVDLPASLRLGPVRSALVLTQSNIITINAPSGGGVGLVCVFPNRYREGLLRMKAEKASALLCQV